MPARNHAPQCSNSAVGGARGSLGCAVSGCGCGFARRRGMRHSCPGTATPWGGWPPTHPPTHPPRSAWLNPSLRCARSSAENTCRGAAQEHRRQVTAFCQACTAARHSGDVGRQNEPTGWLAAACPGMAPCIGTKHANGGQGRAHLEQHLLHVCGAREGQCIEILAVHQAGGIVGRAPPPAGRGACACMRACMPRATAGP